MGIVTGEAVANRRGVHCSLDIGRFFIRMAGEAKGNWSRGDQLDARDVSVDPNFMAARAAHGHGGVDGLALCFVVVAFKTFSGVHFGVQRDGMNRGGSALRQQSQQDNAEPDARTRPAAGGCPAEPDAMREQSHTASEGCTLHEGRRSATR